MITKKLLIVALVVAVLPRVVAPAASPASVEHGRQLFERNWTAGNPSMGSDGLGPLFNGQSCLTCHQQGGVGGGGDSRFNAKTIGIETMTIAGVAVTDDVIATMVRSFHPGFVQASGSVSNTFTLPHHGGSPLLISAGRTLLSQVPAIFSEHGGPTDAEETRQSYATPILFNHKIGPHEITLRARLYHRNTTALFGSGLIDQVSEKAMMAQVKLQRQHPEISGRPSTLDDGRYGKFGWRANVASLLEFNDQACANEVGLETKRKPQARDPMNPAYRNPAIDISDDQIRSMTHFVAALPAPVREIPSDAELRLQAEHGLRVFETVGCAFCHVHNMGPAIGIYSDLLLHDMGSESIDLNFAEPYRVAVTPIKLEQTTTSTSNLSTNYYGRASTMSTSQSTGGRSSGFSRRRQPPPRRYTFVAPTQPAKSNVVDLGSKSDIIVDMDAQNATTTRRRTQQLLLKVHYEPTNLNQEWRTAPLWGVRDSAPYMHDGRAETLLEAIAMHEGEAAGTRDRFLALTLADRRALIAFLNTLVAPPNAPQSAM